MFCHACGAKNAEGSRFCNMCGVALRESSSPLDRTQVGVGADAAVARAIADVRASSPGALAEPSTSPGLGPTEPSTPPASVDASPRRVDAPGPAAIPEGFDPSLSIQLDAIGIRSPRRLWITVGIAAVILLLLGSLGTYFAIGDEPAGHASPDDPFEIGAPTAEVDFVTGSANPTSTQPVAVIDAGVSRRPPPPNLTTNGIPTTSAPRGEPSRTPPSTPPPTQSETRPPANEPSVPPPATPEPAPSEPVPTPEPASSELDAEMYAARVRYLVRRYYAGRAQSCFNAATERNSAVSGQVVLAMHIGADGGVTNARVARNTTGDDALGQCLAGQAESWQLAPPPNGEADLTFPFSR